MGSVRSTRFAWTLGRLRQLARRPVLGSSRGRDVLIIVSGQPRFTTVSTQNIAHTIIGALHRLGYRTHVVFGLWHEIGYEKFRSTVGTPVDPVTMRTAVEVLQPVEVYQEASRDFFASRPTNRIQVDLEEAPSYESQYYMLYQAKEAALAYLTSARISPLVAIKTRADLLFQSPLPACAIASAQKRVMAPLIEGHGWRGNEPPAPWTRHEKWMPDQFWVGRPDQILYMADFWRQWHRGLTRYGPKIERMLYAYAEDGGIECRPFVASTKIEKTVNNS